MLWLFWNFEGIWHEFSRFDDSGLTMKTIFWEVLKSRFFKTMRAQLLLLRSVQLHFCLYLLVNMTIFTL